MALIIYPIKYLNMNDIIVIILQVIIGALIYFCGSKILKLDTYSYILDIIKDKFKNIKFGKFKLKKNEKI